MVKIAKAAGDDEELPEDETTVSEALDVMVRWFCILFNNQFAPDEMYDHYPADRLMHDIALALMAVQTQTTQVLDIFPTKAATEEGGGASQTGGSSGILTLPEYIYATYNTLMENGWRMKEIDEMDMLGFLRIRAWDLSRAQTARQPKRAFIEVWPDMK